MNKKKKTYIETGTQTLLGPVIRVYNGLHFIVECEYSNICLSRDEVEKIMIKENDK
jgi:hypothetical protein